MKKTVFVCGDLVWDTHIARLPVTSLGYYDSHPHTQLTNGHGGSWYLLDLIERAIEAHNERVNPSMNLSESAQNEKMIEAECVAPPKVEHAIVEGDKCPSGIAKGFSVWKWYEGTKKLASAKIGKSIGPDDPNPVIFKWPKDIAPEPGAWRIAEFLGCQAAKWDENFTCLQINHELKKPDILVIDDLGLGFANNEKAWPSCLTNPEEYPEKIIIKGTPPFTSALWKLLLDSKSSLPEKVTVILSVIALREMGATVSRGISWDRTTEDLQREFSTNGAAWILHKCNRVIVTCGRAGAAVFSCTPRNPKEERQRPSNLQFERLLFDPINLEDTWSKQYEGTSFGTGSLMSAAFVVHELTNANNRPSTHITVGRALIAARELHKHNGGHIPKEFKPSKAEKTVYKHDKNSNPWEIFQSAFPRELLDEPVLTAPSLTLLTDVVGTGKEFLTATAEKIVRYGYEGPLSAVPKLYCGKYFTVDREEIENLNTVRDLIEEYRKSSDQRPLSIAVFGAPGAGKSFAIKQLAEEIFGEQKASLEFNLSQFRDLSDLHEAFHEVRDKSIQKQIPLVFWDEFDSKRVDGQLAWYKEFLAPMQDANFSVNGKSHPFGKCIFIFAGGTSRTFQAFDQSDASDDTFFKSIKGPDFVSRLRGFVNIKGPNPTDDFKDEVSVIRRGILLRDLIERHHPRAIHPDTKILKIHSRVLSAFLCVGKYKHGSRSMEAIVSLSHLHENPHFGPSELPPREVIQLHASKDPQIPDSKDFEQILTDNTEYYLLPEDVERLAELKHNIWWKEKEKENFVYGEIRNNNSNPRTHPLCIPYAKLADKDKEANRNPAHLAVLRLKSLGYKIVPADQSKKNEVLTRVYDYDNIKLVRSEHRRWMREKLLKGYAYDVKTSDELLLHRDICKNEDLPKDEHKLDIQIIEAVFDFLQEKNLVLVKKQ